MNITIKDLEDAYYEGDYNGANNDAIYSISFEESNIYKKVMREISE